MSKAFTKEDDTAEPEIVRRPATAGAVHLTREGLARLREEADSLERKRTALANNLPVLETTERRLRELQQAIASAVIVDVSPEKGVVRFGACVRVRSTSDGDESEYRIVGPAEADAGRGRISSASPLAQALLNRRVGDRVVFKYPAGEDTLEILDVSY